MSLGWQLPPERPGRVADLELLERRAAMAGALLPAAPEDSAVEPRCGVLGGRDAIICIPPDPACTLIYLHGGGFHLGAAATWTPFACRLAHAAAAEVILVDYRLAPEFPFPAALRDVAAAYDDVRAHHVPIVVIGDSAGGGLAASLVVACLHSEVSVPSGLVLLSPWLDLTIRASTYISNAETDLLFSSSAASQAAEHYLQGVSNREPLASPMFADLNGFPPTLVLAGGHEVLLADTLEFARQLAFAGVTVQCHVAEGMQHVWPTTHPELSESKRAMADVARFIRRTTS
jgi:monoterpene epsilon-lactone hydrolase